MFPKLKQIFIQNKQLETFPDVFQSVYNYTKVHILILKIHHFEEYVLISTVSMYSQCLTAQAHHLEPKWFPQQPCRRESCNFFLLLVKNPKWLIKTCKCQVPYTDYFRCYLWGWREKKNLANGKMSFSQVCSSSEGHGQCEHLLLVVLSKVIVLIPRNSVLFKEVT